MFRKRASGPANGIPSPCATVRSATSTRTASVPADTETGSSLMVIIAEPIPKTASRFRFFLDRRPVLGAIFVTPAILYVLLLVGVPFLLAVYYSVSAYTIYDPSWRFVGLSNFRQIVH